MSALPVEHICRLHSSIIWWVPVFIYWENKRKKQQQKGYKRQMKNIRTRHRLKLQQIVYSKRNVNVTLNLQRRTVKDSTTSADLKQWFNGFEKALRYGIYGVIPFAILNRSVHGRLLSLSSLFLSLSLSLSLGNRRIFIKGSARRFSRAVTSGRG